MGDQDDYDCCKRITNRFEVGVVEPGTDRITYLPDAGLAGLWLVGVGETLTVNTVNTD